MYKLAKLKLYTFKGSKCILQIISNVVVEEGMGNKGKLHRTAIVVFEKACPGTKQC